MRGAGLVRPFCASVELRPTLLSPLASFTRSLRHLSAFTHVVPPYCQGRVPFGPSHVPDHCFDRRCCAHVRWLLRALPLQVAGCHLEQDRPLLDHPPGTHERHQLVRANACSRPAAPRALPHAASVCCTHLSRLHAAAWPPTLNHDWTPSAATQVLAQAGLRAPA